MMTIDEAKRSDILSKSKTGDSYKKGGNRFTARKKCQVANTTTDYNKIDMNTFWKEDILNFGVKVVGETDKYIVTISFDHILSKIQEEIKRNNNKFNRDIVTKALLDALSSSNNVKINCTCPDFKYRLSYYATQNGFKAGEGETRRSEITNKNDTKGAGCKHILAALSNTNWIRNIASVICNYANWCKDQMENNYAKYIFPKLFGISYQKAINDVNDSELASDEATLNLAISIGKQRGKFGKKS